jgi:alkanesulfonate monooxygenase SsuD/methylene tetrahydromethanopterin reductase-like flavin-dependent oxidoreductase (luciferase family)
LPALRDQASGPGDETGVPEGIAIGDPERVLRACKKWEESGVDRVNFLLNALETVPQEQVLNSLRTFAKHVMPHFQDASTHAAAAGGGGR